MSRPNHKCIVYNPTLFILDTESMYSSKKSIIIFITII